MDIVDGFKQYYVIQFLTKKLTSHVPIRKMDDLGLRTAMTENKVDQVLETLQDTPNELPDHYKQRRKIIEELLMSSDPLEVAEAVRELAWRKDSDGLSTKERQFFSDGKDKLVNEIALVTDSNVTIARRQINRALRQAIKENDVQH